MNISQTTKCRFGWHSWNPWQHINTKGDNYGGMKIFQLRSCSCCGFHQFNSQIK